MGPGGQGLVFAARIYSVLFIGFRTQAVEQWKVDSGQRQSDKFQECHLFTKLKVEEPSQAAEDKVNRYDEIKQPRHKQDQDTGDQGNQRGKRNIHRRKLTSHSSSAIETRNPKRKTS